MSCHIISPVCVCVCVCVWHLCGVVWWLQWLIKELLPGGAECHALRWESENLTALGECFSDLATKQAASMVSKEVGKRVLGGVAVLSLALPMSLVAASSIIDVSTGAPLHW
jgi:hypothetical protein